MRSRLACLLGSFTIATMQLAFAQGSGLSMPGAVEAGNAFSIQSSGSGKATLYIVGPGQVLKRDVQLGESTVFAAGSLYNAGHYLAVLVGDSYTRSGSFDVVPASNPADLSFLAKPSRLPVSVHEGITGAVYMFDTYHNLITAPTQVSFELSTPTGSAQKRVVMTREGAAWIAMDSTAEQGVDHFVARTGAISTTRIVGQVPGDPCGLKMNAHRSGKRVQLITDPLRDCNGNAIPDGTIVTFTQTYNGAKSTVDEPVKHGISQVQMSAHDGATFSVASGVVMGNQFRLEK